MSRRRRGLSDEERQLWDKVARSAEPLRRRRLPPAGAAPQPVNPKKRPSPGKARPPPAKLPPIGQAGRRSRAPAPLAGIDRRTRTRLSRGVARRRCPHRPARTDAEPRPPAPAAVSRGGAGRRRQAGPGDHRQGQAGRRGAAMARSAACSSAPCPAGCRTPEFRHLVASFDEAGRRHGGGGALYVRLRREVRIGG